MKTEISSVGRTEQRQLRKLAMAIPREEMQGYIDFATVALELRIELLK